MTIYPLDAVRNASIDQNLELLLEDVREEVVDFPFTPDRHGGDSRDVLVAYDASRPRFNVIGSQLLDMRGQVGADISTGLGFLPVLLERDGLSVIATEREPEMSDFAAAHGIVVRPYEIGRTSPPIEEGSLDFLIFAEVLEHLNVPPVRVLRELTGLLREDGRFILTTPNVARLQHLELLAAGESFLERFSEETPIGQPATDLLEHVREYSIREVVEASEEAGISVEQVLLTGWGESGYAPLPNPFANEIIVLVGIV